jgi:hypothetical protein
MQTRSNDGQGLPRNLFGERGCREQAAQIAIALLADAAKLKIYM